MLVTNPAAGMITVIILLISELHFVTMWKNAMIKKNNYTVLCFCLAQILLFGCKKNAEIEDFTLPPPNESEASNIPINDPDEFMFEGLHSGLYPWGNSLVDNQYKTDYINISQSIGTLNTLGANTEVGDIVILSLGPSNPHKIYEGIETAEYNDIGFGENINFINGALGGIDFNDILDFTGSYWMNVDSILQTENTTADQIEVIFCIEDDLLNQDTSITRAYQIKDNYILLLEEIRLKFPNCVLFLVGDKGYNNYSIAQRFAEPRGYLNGWGVKLLVEDYINGALPEYPFINWLDYYWADGEIPRWDGLTYSLTDFIGPDYIHLTSAKAYELGVATHEKLKSDPGGMFWYK